MSTRQTRRQAAQAAQSGSPAPAVEIQDPIAIKANGAAMNGNGSAHAGPALSEHAEKENIFLFWPNIIGYFRIVLAVASLYYMPLHPRTCCLLYSISCLLDALDGYAARWFEQSTRFGAILDMGLISLDLASHYMHMYASLVVGGSNSSHKNIDKSQSKILNLYYTNRTVLFIFCTFNELFFIALYLLSFSSPLLSPSLLRSVGDDKVAADIHAGAQVNSSLLNQIFPDPYSAAALEFARANKMDSTIPWILAGISFPIMAGKQIINVVQLVKASKWLAEVDVEHRRAQGLPRKPKTA
ncbi:unnamed protein product [Parascedosporium putredinis]|uniref:CDP-diacylglycerol--inositol 3-phosphatidyltransferase n=1 Tax=Parascedosporium putredinis TaxID=1442378 RepID=A0A9P1GWD8_9PEZI|nr:unnamed protein product [Parascedosporium putredinis]CAI7988757.1 unnamed protein product [Parascedosporium putredinis]